MNINPNNTIVREIHKRDLENLLHFDPDIYIIPIFNLVWKTIRATDFLYLYNTYSNHIGNDMTILNNLLNEINQLLGETTQTQLLQNIQGRNINHKLLQNIPLTQQEIACIDNKLIQAIILYIKQIKFFNRDPLFYVLEYVD